MEDPTERNMMGHDWTYGGDGKPWTRLDTSFAIFVSIGIVALVICGLLIRAGY